MNSYLEKTIKEHNETIKNKENELLVEAEAYCNLLEDELTLFYEENEKSFIRSIKIVENDENGKSDKMEINFKNPKTTNFKDNSKLIECLSITNKMCDIRERMIKILNERGYNNATFTIMGYLNDPVYKLTFDLI